MDPCRFYLQRSCYSIQIWYILIHIAFWHVQYLGGKFELKSNLRWCMKPASPAVSFIVSGSWLRGRQTKGQRSWWEKRTWEGMETRNANIWLESHIAKEDWGREVSFQPYSFWHLNRQNHSTESICISGTSSS